MYSQCTFYRVWVAYVEAKISLYLNEFGYFIFQLPFRWNIVKQNNISILCFMKKNRERFCLEQASFFILIKCIFYLSLITIWYTQSWYILTKCSCQLNLWDMHFICDFCWYFIWRVHAANFAAMFGQHPAPSPPNFGIPPTLTPRPAPTSPRGWWLPADYPKQ